MDVRSWLQHTVDRASPEPGPSERRSPPRPLPESPNEDVKRRRKYRRKRKRERESPSSTGAPSPPPENRPSSDDDTSSVEVDLTRSDSVESTHSNRASEKTSEAASAKGPYDRRARRKTRTDRYESKRKKAKNAQSGKPKRATKKKEQKDDRGRDGVRTQDLIQSFQMKNGPKKKRLTLPTRNSLGIFKHGRASHQTSGSRSGLPDLAFNEMKFLQKPRHEDANQTSRDSPLPSREAKRRKSEDERISTYFQTGLESAKDAPRRHADQHRSNIHHNLASDQTSLARVEKARLDILEPIQILSSDNGQLPQPRNDHADRRSQDGSNRSSRCLTWSISVADKALVSLPSLPSDLVQDNDETRAEVRKSDDFNGFEAEQHQAQRQRIEHPTHGLASIKDSRTRAAPSRQASVPTEQATESLSRKNDFQGTTGISNHHTSEILHIGADVSATPDPIVSRHSGKAASTVDKENIDPIRSTPSSSVLRMAFQNIYDYPLAEHEAHRTQGQEFPQSGQHLQRPVAQISGRSPRVSAGWSPTTLQSHRSEVPVRTIPQRGLHRPPNVATMSPAMPAAQRPGSTRSLEARLRSQRPGSAVFQRDSSRYLPSTEPHLTLPARLTDMGASRRSFISGAHLDTGERRSTSSAYHFQCGGDFVQHLDDNRNDGDGNLEVRTDVHEEDTPAALLAWDKSQATHDVDANYSGLPSDDHDLDLRLQESDIRLQYATIEDIGEDWEVQHDYMRSIDDREPSPQELEGFWRPQKFY